MRHDSLSAVEMQLEGGAMLKATVSGSFHRHMSKIHEAVVVLTNVGVQVLSPADPRVVDHEGEFLFVASDLFRSIKLVQDRHFACISASDFLWLVAPDGYVGTSASMEIGAAVAAGVEIFCESEVLDITLRQYVRKVSGLRDCLTYLHSRARTRPDAAHFLVDPLTSITRAHEVLETLEGYYHSPSYSRDKAFSTERRIKGIQEELAKVFSQRVFRRA